MTRYSYLILMCLLAAAPLFALTTGAPLYFREDWTETPPEVPVTQAHVHNPDLLLQRHGPAGNVIKKSWHENKPGDPWYIWSGLCEDRWALSLRKKNALVDLSERGRVRIRTKQIGGRVLKIILELEDGSWLVSTSGFGETPDWQVFEVNLDILKWQSLNIDSIEAGPTLKNPDLRRIRSIGWTDLASGAGSTACTRVDWMEVYGVTVTH